MDLKEIGWEYVDWIHLAQDKDRWRACHYSPLNKPWNSAKWELSPGARERRCWPGREGRMHTSRRRASDRTAADAPRVFCNYRTRICCADNGGWNNGEWV